MAVPSAGVERIHHTAITVGDLAQSLAFYRDALGMAEIVRRRIQDGYLATLMGRPGLDLELVILRAGDTKLELIAYRSPPRVAYVPADGNPGAAHVSIVVDDVRAWHARLTATGVRSVSAPVAIDDGPNRGGWAVFLIDPDGLWVELLEFTPARRRELGAPYA